jgi:hypothetical protein|tara:strand:- start:157 stop:345 length:189 start_codon:yes stop_codon:yes gene_type:complete
MIVIDAFAEIMAAAARFYWVVASAIAIVVFGIRWRGYSSISAVPAVATITVFVCFVILKSYL